MSPVAQLEPESARCATCDAEWHLDFSLPTDLEAGEPPEARGLDRDEVRLMVSRGSDERIVHTRFTQLPAFLDRGDVLVVNTSGTRNAALEAVREDGLRLELHLSTRLPSGIWLVELRRPTNDGTQPFFEGIEGETYTLPDGAWTMLIAPHRSRRPARLWVAALHVAGDLDAYLWRHGFPIRYRYVRESWPSEYYQTAFATEPGSAEMPSAGRAFTHRVLTRLVARGVQIAQLLLHTGVASLESHEAPYEEFYRVPAETAEAINHAHAEGRRVIAVGTTVVRALETVADPEGRVHASEGWTDLVITPERGMRSVDGLLTGMHEPKSSHLLMLEALAGRPHLALAYREAIARKYLWHEFGDLHLILPSKSPV